MAYLRRDWWVDIDWVKQRKGRIFRLHIAFDWEGCDMALVLGVVGLHVYYNAPDPLSIWPTNAASGYALGYRAAPYFEGGKLFKVVESYRSVKPQMQEVY